MEPRRMWMRVPRDPNIEPTWNFWSNRVSATADADCLEFVVLPAADYDQMQAALKPAVPPSATGPDIIERLEASKREPSARPNGWDLLVADAIACIRWHRQKATIRPPQVGADRRRAEWAMYAAASLWADSSVESGANLADRMLAEADRRFSPDDQSDVPSVESAAPSEA